MREHQSQALVDRARQPVATLLPSDGGDDAGEEGSRDPDSLQFPQSSGQPVACSIPVDGCL